MDRICKTSELVQGQYTCLCRLTRRTPFQHGCQKTPIIFVAARELPKGASCEWQVVRHTGDPSWPAVPREPVTNADDSDEEDDDACAVRVRYDQGKPDEGLASISLDADQ